MQEPLNFTYSLSKGLPPAVRFEGSQLSNSAPLKTVPPVLDAPLLLLVKILKYLEGVLRRGIAVTLSLLSIVTINVLRR